MAQQFFSLDALRLPRFYCNGPFVLDGMESAAYINGRQLDLTEDEYNTLYLLAEREGFHIPFTQLYKAVWEKYDGSDRCGEAREGLKNINRQLHTIKNNGPHIGYSLLKGFTLQTKLRKNNFKYIAAAALAVCIIMATAINMITPVSPANTVLFINEETPLGGAEFNETDVKAPEQNAINNPGPRGPQNGEGPRARLSRNGLDMTY